MQFHLHSGLASLYYVLLARLTPDCIRYFWTSDHILSHFSGARTTTVDTL